MVSGGSSTPTRRESCWTLKRKAPHRVGWGNWAQAKVQEGSGRQPLRAWAEVGLASRGRAEVHLISRVLGEVDLANRGWEGADSGSQRGASLPVPIPGEALPTPSRIPVSPWVPPRVGERILSGLRARVISNPSARGTKRRIMTSGSF